MLFQGLLDLLWPCTCLGCGVHVLRPGFCGPCADLVCPRDGAQCARCDTTLPTEAPVHTCGRCLTHPPAFARAWGAFDYAGPVGEAIRAGKYQGRLDGLPAVARALAAALPPALRADPPQAVLPMPLHPKRLHTRRLDAPLVLAAAVARSLGVPLCPRVAIRQRDTPPQAGLSEVARRANVQGAFAVRRPPPADVLVVDDVVTTGATADALCAVLTQAGARRVRVLAAAAVERARGGV